MRLEYIISKIEWLLKKQLKFRRNTELWKILGTLKARVYGLLFIIPPVHSLTFEEIISSYSSQKKDIFFIQIGACDGVQDDPINKFIIRDNWSGILIEPVECLYNELTSNYKHFKNIVFENCAIADKDEIKPFYYLKDTDFRLPSWKKGLGSFNPDHITLEDKQYLVAQAVDCIRFDTLLTKHNVKRVDLLLIDTEGYDYEIIKQINFGKIKPDILIYEFCNLNVEDNNKCIRFLINNGYKLYKERTEILAIREFVDKQLILK